MAEPVDSNQTKDQAEGEKQELSPDQLDRMILSAAPDFANDLKEMQSLVSDGTVDLDVVDLGKTFPVKENPWLDPVGTRKLIVSVLPFLPKLWDLQYRFLVTLQLSRESFKTTLREAGPKLLQATKSGAVGAKEYLKGRSAAFASLTTGLKLVALVLVLTGALIAFFVYRSFTKGVLPADKDYLMASLEEWSAQSYKYDPETEMDSFYDSPRTIQNIMSLPKMIVNLRPSVSSGPNPMAALEFFLEGLSPEAIVEVKDRETEIRDLFQRTIEEVTYNEMESTEGKQQLTERLRQALNAHLTKGKIRRVFFKEAVIKP